MWIAFLYTGSINFYYFYQIYIDKLYFVHNMLITYCQRKLYCHLAETQNVSPILKFPTFEQRWQTSNFMFAHKLLQYGNTEDYFRIDIKMTFT